MNADEKEIYDFLAEYGEAFISVTEISKRLGHRKRYEMDRCWARPILRRMELDGHLESNPFGEYRIYRIDGETTRFKRALHTPGAALGDTTIISIDDVKD